MNDRSDVDASALLSNRIERRAAAQVAEQERALARQRALASQSAWDAIPAERIRRWEQLHALTLPSAVEHPLVAVVAAHTNLTLSDISDEQQRRHALSQAGLSAKAP